MFKVVIRVCASIIETIFKKASLEILWWPRGWDPTLPLQGALVPSHACGMAKKKRERDFLHPVLEKHVFVFETFLFSISRLMTATLAL